MSYNAIDEGFQGSFVRLEAGDSLEQIQPHFLLDVIDVRIGQACPAHQLLRFVVNKAFGIRNSIVVEMLKTHNGSFRTSERRVGVEDLDARNAKSGGALRYVEFDDTHNNLRFAVSVLSGIR